MNNKNIWYIFVAVLVIVLVAWLFYPRPARTPTNPPPPTVEQTFTQPPEKEHYTHSWSFGLPVAAQWMPLRDATAQQVGARTFMRS